MYLHILVCVYTLDFSLSDACSFCKLIINEYLTSIRLLTLMSFICDFKVFNDVSTSQKDARDLFLSFQKGAKTISTYQYF